MKSFTTNTLLGCPENGENGCFYNSVFDINKAGNLIGTQRKNSSITDQWSSSGLIGECEQRSKNTGLPIFFCNRTGEDETVGFWEAESIVIKDGKQLLSYKSSQSSILYFN